MPECVRETALPWGSDRVEKQFKERKVMGKQRCGRREENRVVFTGEPSPHRGQLPVAYSA